MQLILQPGMEVRANVELIEVAGRKLIFTVEAHDGVDVISRGRHERFVIDKAKFDAKLALKAGGGCYSAEADRRAKV